MPQKSQQSRRQRTHAHRGPLPGQVNKWTKEQCLETRRLSGKQIQQSGRTGSQAVEDEERRGPRGRQQVQGTCWESATVEGERELWLPCMFVSPQEAGGQWTSEEDGGTGRPG